MNTISLEERQWISEHAVIEVGNKEGRTYKIADMKVIMKRIRNQRFKDGLSANISIMPIREDIRKVHNYSFSVLRDKQFDVRYGIYLGLNAKGEPKFQPLTLSETMDLDLTRDDDALFWIVAQFHPKLKGSPFEEKPYFKVWDQSIEILGQTTKMTALTKAVGRVNEMKLKQKIYFLRYLQVTLQSTYNEDIINGLLFEKITADPFGFNDKFESASRSIYEIFNSAMLLGIITFSPERGYYFEGVKLGNVDYDVIGYIAKDKMIFGNIVDKLGKLDHIATSIEDRTKKKVLISESKDAVNVTEKQESIKEDDPEAW